MTPRQAEAPTNAECPWDTFDSVWYVDHNYRRMRHDDGLILEKVRDHFARFFTGAADLALGADRVIGVDVGPGANLYPSLAMLPFCDEIHLWEHSASNVDWLEREVGDYAPNWDEFWQDLERHPAYQIDDPRAKLRQVARVHKGSLFDLGNEQFDVGTMFFVAESMTAKPDEFEAAVSQFIRALRPGRPFAAAFMQNSTGYTVAGQRFPAVAVTEADIKKAIGLHQCEVALEPIPLWNPIRDGYDGMVLATGRTADRSQ